MKNSYRKPEIVYQSNSIAQNGEPFLTVKKADGYYLYAQRLGVDSIAFILIDNKAIDKPYGLISEIKPPLYERNIKMLTTAFGGSIDKDMSSVEICQAEVLEEAGYTVSKESIHYIGNTMVSTQMNQFCEGYVVDITDLKAQETEADTNERMKDNKVVWMSYDELLLNSDWKSIWILTTYEYKQQKGLR